jgi:hypothetical protein
MAAGYYDTDFNINDIVYFRLESGGLFRGCISEIYLHLSKSGITVFYEIGISGKGSWKVNSSIVYRTPEKAFLMFTK